MKKIARTRTGAGAGKRRIPAKDEAEVADILISLPKLSTKSGLIGRFSFTWGRKKKRSVLISKPKSLQSQSPSPSPLTPLCKPPATVPESLKREAADDLMEVYNRLQEEKETLMKKVKAIKTLHQELTSENIELKARGQKINYSRNMENFYMWNSHMKLVNQQHCHQQMMFASATPQQFMVDPNNGGGRFGWFNHIDPRVKIHGLSQPLDHSKYLVMDNNFRVRAAAAAAARKRRMLRMKEGKIHGEVDDFMQPLDHSKHLEKGDDLRVRAAAAARKRRILRMKENKKYSMLGMKVPKCWV